MSLKIYKASENLISALVDDYVILPMFYKFEKQKKLLLKIVYSSYVTTIKHQQMIYKSQLEDLKFFEKKNI